MNCESLLFLFDLAADLAVGMSFSVDVHIEQSFY
jgi:hypothetical protein